MSVSDSEDRRMFRAYQHVKNARIDGDYQAIMRWMTVVDRLLDERLARRACGPDGSSEPVPAADVLHA